ncbi:hypothetical protein [Falsiphaeobacter marinintestinus]|uniref:hypothetical protein n=1 Tax=Falsiphaeobacter marinintestinus TaxID=1492905 RepID=UPI0011B3BE71|nr:hypothetical protein [Phaeobacter marinintestinus]
MDCCKYELEHITADRDLGELVSVPKLLTTDNYYTKLPDSALGYQPLAPETIIPIECTPTTH